jgi:hypothetical protein
MSTLQVVLVLVVVLVLAWTRHHTSHRFALLVKTDSAAGHIAQLSRNQKATEKISRKADFAPSPPLASSARDAKAQRKARGRAFFGKNIRFCGQEFGEFRRVAAN